MLLTLDSALGHGSAALVQRDGTSAQLEIPEKGAQAKHMLAIIEQLLQQAGKDYVDVNRIICTTGPGGFTGIRIALATARALAFTAKKHISGVSTLAALAYGCRELHGEHKTIHALLPAGKGMVYFQSFNGHNLQPQNLPAMVPLEHLAPDACYVTSNISDIFGAEHINMRTVMLDAKLVGALALDCAAEHLLGAPEPLYIRPPDISTPKSQSSQV